jgi:ribosomal protein S18 acetylase RimI-like enzyme
MRAIEGVALKEEKCMSLLVSRKKNHAALGPYQKLGFRTLGLNSYWFINYREWG